MHFDSDEAVDGRRLSAIFYLNPDWQPGDGGALRLFPFGAPPVDIAPTHDRLVLFASTRMLHRCEHALHRAANAPNTSQAHEEHLQARHRCCCEAQPHDAGLCQRQSPKLVASWLAA